MLTPGFCECGKMVSPGAKRCRSCNLKARNADPEFAKANAERGRNMMNALHADPEFAKANSERMKARHADPEFKKARSEWMKALHADPEFAKAHAERSQNKMKARNADPEFAKAHAERGRNKMKALNADPEFAKANSERMKALNADPEFAKANSERMKVLNADPEFAKARAERGRSTMNTHPELRLNGYGRKTAFDGHVFPSRAEAQSFEILKRLGGRPRFSETIPPIETPYGHTYPDTMLEHSVLRIPAGIPIELKDGDGSYPWSLAQVWAVENGETCLVCAEDLPGDSSIPESLQPT